MLPLRLTPPAVDAVATCRELQELPIRLSQRLADFYSLPYIIGCNPHLRDVVRA